MRYISTAILLLGLWTGAYAEIYKWVDPQGRIQFSDRPPLDAQVEEVQLRKLNTFQGVTVEDFQDMGSGRTWGEKTKKVVMQSAPWCGVCARAKRFLKAKGIPFRELDVERNGMARRELERMNARGVPVILVGDKRMNGFSEDRFMALYED